MQKCWLFTLLHVFLPEQKIKTEQWDRPLCAAASKRGGSWVGFWMFLESDLIIALCSSASMLREMTNSFCSKVLKKCCLVLKWEYQGREVTTLQKSWYGMPPVILLPSLYVLVWRHTTACPLTLCYWPNSSQKNTPGTKSLTGYDEHSRKIECFRCCRTTFSHLLLFQCQQVSKKKKKKKMESLLGAPFHLKDGDTIGVKVLIKHLV